MPQPSRRCSFRCRQVLPLDVHNFYPVKGGGFTAACKGCLKEKRRSKHAKTHVTEFGFFMPQMQGSLKEAHRAVSKAYLGSNPAGWPEHRLRTEFARLISRCEDFHSGWMRLWKHYKDMKPDVRHSVLIWGLDTYATSEASRANATKPQL